MRETRNTRPNEGLIPCRLKAIIEAAMPTAVEKYNAECQRIAEDK